MPRFGRYYDVGPYNVHTILSNGFQTVLQTNFMATTFYYQSLISSQEYQSSWLPSLLKLLLSLYFQCLTPHSAKTSQNSTQSEFFTQAGTKPDVNGSQNRSFLEIQQQNTKYIKYVYSIKKSTFTTEIRKYTLNQKCKLLHKIFFIDKIKIHDTMIEIQVAT